MSENNKEKVYIGNGKKANSEYDIINGSICLDDIWNYVKENPIEAYKNGKKYLNITVASRREPDKFGNTHAITVNNWKPDKDYANKAQDNTDNEDDVPF